MLCKGCFQEVRTKKVCTECGYHEGKKRSTAFHLPYGSKINDKINCLYHII